MWLTTLNLKKKKEIIIISDSLIKSQNKYKRLKEINYNISILFYTLEGVEYNKGLFYRLRKSFTIRRKLKPEKPQIPEGVERFNPTFEEGLTSSQVEKRKSMNFRLRIPAEMP